MNRRGFLAGILAVGAAPAFVGAANPTIWVPHKAIAVERYWPHLGPHEPVTVVGCQTIISSALEVGNVITISGISGTFIVTSQTASGQNILMPCNSPVQNT